MIEIDARDRAILRILQDHAGITNAELAERVMQLLRRAEFKRRQAPPLLKIGGRAFGSGWRMPIAAGA